MFYIRNVHERRLAAGPAAAGALIDTLASDGDRLWPSDRWPPLRLDGPLSPGARGGHAFVRYSVEEHEPGVRIAFRFDPRMRLDGAHRFEVVAGRDGSILRHVLEASPRGHMRLAWPLVVRPLHDALIEDSLDRAQRELGERPPPRRWSRRVRLLRRMLSRPGDDVRGEAPPQHRLAGDLEGR